LTHTPDALIVVGDAMRSFNPLYGQGMSVAGIEALILRDCLQHGNRDLPQRFFGDSAKEIRTSWQAAVGSDLALPQIPGRRPMSVQLTNAYLDRVLAAAETDPAVVQAIPATNQHARSSVAFAAPVDDARGYQVTTKASCTQRQHQERRPEMPRRIGEDRTVPTWLPDKRFHANAAGTRRHEDTRGT
jgi:hypothetical protein